MYQNQKKCPYHMAERILHRHPQQFSINVRAGIVGDRLAGLHGLPHQLTGNHY
jgi:hypothetical protein